MKFNILWNKAALDRAMHCCWHVARGWIPKNTSSYTPDSPQTPVRVSGVYGFLVGCSHEQDRQH